LVDRLEKCNMGMRADGRIDGLELEWLRTGGEEIPGRLQSLIDCSRTGIADGFGLIEGTHWLTLDSLT
jgi:hypothetical protein